MMRLHLAESCRLSGESLRDARQLFEVERCPLPGIYPEDPDESSEMTSPLRVVQSRQSAFVQLAHVFDGEIYRQYAFAGGGAGAYRRHLSWFADEIAARFSHSASILEVGCGDGSLLRELKRRGYSDATGIDPSRAASKETCDWLVSGYFPHDLPADQRKRSRNLVVCRHVLEHIESPGPFLQALAEVLMPTGELWIEVPDLDCAIQKGIWSNFYQLHCNYFSANTLDLLAATAGLRCVSGRVVDVFGGSILRRYTRGRSRSIEAPDLLDGIATRVDAYRKSMVHLAESLPEGSVGYGAAERTAVILGIAPVFSDLLTALYDGNPLLQGRHLAGTRLPIKGKDSLYNQKPPAIVLFAISNAEEILAGWKRYLEGETLVGVAGGRFPLKPLKEYP